MNELGPFIPVSRPSLTCAKRSLSSHGRPAERGFCWEEKSLTMHVRSGLFQLSYQVSGARELRHWSSHTSSTTASSSFMLRASCGAALDTSSAARKGEGVLLSTLRKYMLTFAGYPTATPTVSRANATIIHLVSPCMCGGRGQREGTIIDSS